MSWHARLPWDTVRWIYLRIKQDWFQKSKPDDRPTYTVAEDIEKIRYLFGINGYGLQPFAYDKGEDLSLMYHVFWEDHDYTHDGGEKIVWWQIHVRIWDNEDGTLDIMPHFEPRPYTSDREHITGTGFEFQHGIEEVGRLLEYGNVSIVSDPR